MQLLPPEKPGDKISDGVVKDGQGYRLSWYLNTVIVIVLIAGCIGCLLEGPWIEKVCLLYSMRVSLFTVTMGPGVLKMGAKVVLSAVLRLKLAQWNKETSYAFDDFHAFICQIPATPGAQAPCSLWDQLKAGTYVMLIFGAFGLVGFVVGWFMEWEYCKRPKKMTKRIVRVIYTVSSCMMLLGLGVYYGVAFEIKMTVPVTHFSVLSSHFWLAAVITCISPAPVIINFLFVPRELDELLNQVVSAERKQQRDVDRQQAWEEREYGPGGFAAAMGVQGGGYGAVDGMQPGMQPVMMVNAHGGTAW